MVAWWGDLWASKHCREKGNDYVGSIITVFGNQWCCAPPRYHLQACRCDRVLLEPCGERFLRGYFYLRNMFFDFRKPFLGLREPFIYHISPNIFSDLRLWRPSSRTSMEIWTSIACSLLTELPSLDLIWGCCGMLREGVCKTKGSVYRRPCKNCSGMHVERVITVELRIFKYAEMFLLIRIKNVANILCSRYKSESLPWTSLLIPFQV